MIIVTFISQENFLMLIKDKNVFYNKCPFGVVYSHFTSVMQRHHSLN